MKKVLGINVNLSAVSWALADRAESDCETGALLRAGVRVPNLSPVEKLAFARGDAAATNLQRKEQRVIRRMRNRYLLRRQRLIEALRREHLLSPSDLLSEDGLDTTYETWKLRAKAASEQISLPEFSRVLLMMNKSRGCTTKRRIKDTTWYDELHAGDLTYGQFICGKVLAGEPLSGQLHLRADSIAEFDRVWDCQAAFHPELTPELKAEIRDRIIFYQRPMKSEKSSVPFCPYESWEREIEVQGAKVRIKRMGCRVAPRSSPLFQRLRIWEVLNNLTLWPFETSVKRSITLEEKCALAAELEFREEMSSDEVLEFLFQEEAKGYSMNYSSVKGNVTIARLAQFLPKEMLAFDPLLPKEDYERHLPFRLWHLIYSLGGDDEEDLLAGKIRELTGVDDETAHRIAGVEFEERFCGLSHKAMRKILPVMMSGVKYSQAVVAAGYKYGTVTAGTLDRMPDLSANHFWNPVIEKLFFQVIHIVNALIEEGQKPDAIRLCLYIPAGSYVRKEMQRLLKMAVYHSKVFFRKRDEASDVDYIADAKDALRIAAGSGFDKDEFERQSQHVLDEMLVSYRVQGRVATANTNRIKVGGGRVVEQKCLTPRRQIHKEQIYRRKETADGAVTFVIRKPASGDDLQEGQKKMTVGSRIPAYPLRWKRDKEGRLILDSEGNPIPNDYAIFRNNHHVAVYEDTDGKLHEEVVTFKQALDRRVKGRPAVDRDYNRDAGWGFCYSICINEMFVFPDESAGFEPKAVDLMDRENRPLIGKHLFRVQKLSHKSYSFVLHSNPSLEQDRAMKDITWKRVHSPAGMKGAIKVRLNHLGEIVEVGDVC